LAALEPLRNGSDGAPFASQGGLGEAVFGASEKRGWPAPAEPAGQVRLRFDTGGDNKTLRNFSAGTRVGDSLFLAADERAAIDRLTPDGGDGGDWANHARYPLADLVDLADPEAEADLEGLASDEGWLWVLGSHARTRPKPEKAEGECIDLDLLADLKDTRPRCLLARLPLVESGGGLEPVRNDGGRKAGLLHQGKHGNDLSKALKRDPLIGPFMRIPAKEGGVDIEGIAVCGERIALGMRGPVIATHALLLELEVKAKPSGKLALSGAPVKRLLAMEGLGIRDLKRRGSDLIILAGPSTGLSGPCALYLWPGWAEDPPQDDRRVRLHRPERLFDLPFGRGADHPEGLALWDDGARILVIYDSPSKERFDKSGRTITADLFDLPR
jgi:hypothetical protein